MAVGQQWALQRRVASEESSFLTIMFADVNMRGLLLAGIILGGLGYYFGLQGANRTGQILGIVAVVLSVISIVISGVSGGPQ